MLPVLVCMFLLPSAAKASHPETHRKRISVADRERSPARRLPTVDSVTMVAGTFKAGDEIQFTIHMHEDVWVTGTPKIFAYFDTGGPIFTQFVSIANNRELTFKGTIPAGAYDMTGVTVGGTIWGASISDVSGNLPSLPDYTGISTFVDAVAPRVTKIALPAGKNYIIGDELILVTTFSKPITQTGTPSLLFRINGAPGGERQAAYLDSIDPVTRRFKYTVAEGDEGTSLYFAGEVITKNYYDTIGNPLTDATLITPVPYPNSVMIDGIRPFVRQVNLVGPLTRNDGNAFFEVVFSENMASFGHQVNLSPGLAATGSVTMPQLTVFECRYTATGSGTISVTLPANGLIKDIAGNAMATSYTSAAYTMDQTRPGISSIDFPADRSYRAGEQLSFTVNFSEPIIYFTGGSPLNEIWLNIITGSTTRKLFPVSYSATSMTFTYTVASTDNDTDGIGIQSFGTGAPNSIIDSVYNPLDPVIDPALVQNAIKLDNTSPVVTGFSMLPGHFGAGQMVTIVAQFDEPVTVAGVPSVTAATTKFTGAFEYAGGSGTNTLRFNFPVPAGLDESRDLFFDQQIHLNGGSIKDFAGNDLGSVSPVVILLSGAYLDGMPPYVTQARMTDPALTVKSGKVHFEVFTSEPVTCTDLPNFITVNTAAVVNTTTVAQTSPTTFTVELDITGIADTVLPVSVTVPGAVPVKDMGGNVMTTSFTSDEYHIDEQAPYITGIVLPRDSMYKEDDILTFLVNINETVVMQHGFLQLGLTLAQGGTVWANGQAVQNGLQFKYTVKNGDVDYNTIQLSNALRVAPGYPGTTVTDRAGNALSLGFSSIPSLSGISVDGVAPKITSWLPVSPKTYKIGDTISMEGITSKNIFITGTPELTLHIGGAPYTAPAIPASGPNRVAFGYVVKEGIEGTVYATGYTLNGSIRDTAGNDLVFIPGPMMYDVGVDGVRPLITRIAAPVTTGKIGDEVWIDVIFNERMVAQPGALLQANIGVRTVDFTFSELRDAFTARFVYVVKEGDIAPAGVTVSSVSGVTDGAGNESVPANNVPSSLLVDGIRPVLDSISVLSGPLTNNPVLHYVLHMSEPVSTPFSPNFITTGDIGIDHTAFTVSGNDVRLDVSTTGNNGTVQLAIDPAAVNITDANGNAAVQHKLTSQPIRIRIGAPVITELVPPADSSYGVGNILTYTLTTSEELVITGGTPSLHLLIGGVVLDAAMVSAHGKTMVFQYTVLEGQEDWSPLYVTSDLELNGSTVADSAGNLLATAIPVDPLKPAPRIYIHARPPVLSNLSFYRSGVYPKGDQLGVAVYFDRSVKMLPEVSLLLKIGDKTVIARPDTVAAEGQNFPFLFTVEEGMYDMDGITVEALQLNGVSITDEYHNVAKTNFAPQTFRDVMVDAIPPVILSFKRVDPSPSNKDTLYFRVVFSKKMGNVQRYGFSVVKTPSVFYANPVTIATINDSTYDIGVRVFGTGTVGLQPIKNSSTDTWGNYLEQVSGVSELYTIDNYPPYISDLILPPAGTYKLGEAIILKGTILEPVTITGGTPSIDLNLRTGGTVKAYLVKNESSELTFQYIVKNGDLDATGITINPLLQLNGSRPVDAMGNVMDTGIDNVPATTAILVDGIVPVVVNASPTVADIPDVSLCADVADHSILAGGVSAGPEANQVVTAGVTADQSFFATLTATYNNDTTVIIRYQLKAGASGDARITLTITDNGGTENGGIDRVSKSFVLSVQPMPVLSVTTTPGQDILPGEQVLLTAVGAATYQWEDAAGIVSGKSTDVLTVRPVVTTTYTVTAATAAGCSATAATTIRVAADTKFEATNILTPNGDGINDRWLIKNIGRYPLNSVKIFDRNGRLIYTKSGYNNEWDGMLNGKILGQDTYYYIVDLGDGSKVQKGFITILRK